MWGAGDRPASRQGAPWPRGPVCRRSSGGGGAGAGRAGAPAWAGGGGGSGGGVPRLLSGPLGRLYKPAGEVAPAASRSRHSAPSVSALRPHVACARRPSPTNSAQVRTWCRPRLSGTPRDGVDPGPSYILRSSGGGGEDGCKCQGADLRISLPPRAAHSGPSGTCRVPVLARIRGSRQRAGPGWRLDVAPAGTAS